MLLAADSAGWVRGFAWVRVIPAAISARERLFRFLGFSALFPRIFAACTDDEGVFFADADSAGDFFCSFAATVESFFL